METFKAATEDSLWADRGATTKKEGPVSYGVGIAGTTYQSGARQLGHQSCGAIIRICEDGTVNLLTGATDCGQGSDTVLAMIAAEVLGVKYEDVSIKRVDWPIPPWTREATGAGSLSLRARHGAGGPGRKEAAP
jgi:CO/xanthine dehydrogenase Mo-binding subunit